MTIHASIELVDAMRGEIPGYSVDITLTACGVGHPGGMARFGPNPPASTLAPHGEVIRRAFAFLGSKQMAKAIEDLLPVDCTCCLGHMAEARGAERTADLGVHSDAEQIRLAEAEQKGIDADRNEEAATRAHHEWLYEMRFKFGEDP